MALRRYHCLEKRLSKDPELAQVLEQKITDYINKGYIRKLSQKEIDQHSARTWYLPIFAVTNINKPGKVRLVWDAAATAFGKSLNSALLKGPDQTCSLFAILLRFREGRIGLTGDIREMFHQVLIREADQTSQRFFWKESTGEIGVYAMRVMTFGACCSPSSAQFVKNMNAERFRERSPAAYEAITKSHYVDDIFISVDSEEEAIQLANEVKNVHAAGGFEIRNWISNSTQVLATLNESTTEEKCLDLASEMSTEKVLGMWWNTASDVFTYKVGWDRYDSALLLGQRFPTKREVLQVLMTIYDPIGLIAHFLAFLKVILQEIWRSGTLWDETINEEAFCKWRLWLKVLPQVENVKIPRCYRDKIALDEANEIQLHTFVDASENAMAALVMLRIIEAREIECSLATAKTRVAPIKFTSIPRLELEAAMIGARLARTVSDSLSLQPTAKYYWSDSRDVLCWLNSDHRRYTQFVAYRVSEILESTEASEWRWIPSKQNVADDATKWDLLPNLSPDGRWFKGPDFLWQEENLWPQQLKQKCSTVNELRPSFVAVHQTLEPVICVENYSSWCKLVRIVAYVQRFLKNFQLKHLTKSPIMKESLSSDELCIAENYLLSQAQRAGYLDEFAILQRVKRNPCSTETIPSTSSLYQLAPWMDNHGVMRMKTRIGACQHATDNAKNPIILPRYHYTTTLIIKYYHEKYHHLNQETVVNEIRQKYRIPRLRVCLAQVRKSCQRCKNDRAIPQPPIMADLPPARLAAFTRPFTYVGVDYFGPIETVVGRRVEKRWGMLVTCLTIRAVHIEVVNSLTTSSCIMALRNFIARRGTPRKIYSDRGTNFIGTNRELKTVEKTLGHEELMKEFVSAELEWIFNPPMSPHMGGSWERLIRTVKTNLLAVCSMKKLSDEVLRNLVTEIENTVNSCPLTHVPIDHYSAPALTPNHFLLGSSDGCKPLSVCDDTGNALAQNWSTSQILANRYWRRWVTDYLPEITRRTKWHQTTKPISVDDVAIIVDPKLPRNCWPKGRIISVRIGKDRQIRSATLQTASGVYERPTAKLAILDVRCD
ncbi:uncharacterized protein LOC134207186 [Armigeres subalbatus]|uniref:uncharacterized protein LOC134207186 n=1 Tax=Armigeres subalbatus TaxID=124917 RepID=UPI002ED01972